MLGLRVGHCCGYWGLNVSRTKCLKVLIVVEPIEEGQKMRWWKFLVAALPR